MSVINETEYCANENQKGVVYNSSEFLRTICLIILIIVPVYTIFCVGCFLRYKNEYVRLYKRNTSMLVLFAAGVILSLYPNAYRLYSGSKEFQCAHLYISEYFDAALLLLPFLIRLTNILLRVNFNRALIEYNFKSLNDGSFLKDVSFGANRFMSNRLEKRPLKLSPLRRCLYTVFCFEPSDDIPHPLHFNYFWTLHRVSNIIFSSIIFFLLIFMLTNPFLYKGCTGCTADESVLYSLPIFAVLFVFGCFVLYFNRDIPDGIGVKHEMKLIALSLLVFEVIALPLYLTHQDYEVEGKFAWSLLFYVQVLIILTISFPYQVYLARQPTNTEYEDDGVTVEHILSHREGSKAFALYLATALCAENVLFYKAVKEWKAKFGRVYKPNIETQGKAIFERYISLDGPMTINLPYNIRDELILKVKNDDYDLNMFDKSCQRIISLLRNNDLYDRFKCSIYYTAFKGSVGQVELDKKNRL